MQVVIEPAWLAPVLGVCLAVIVFGIAAAWAFRD